MSKIEIVKILTNILALRFIQLDERSQLLAAVEYYQESSISLEDAYHLAYAQSNQATNIATFDHKLLKIFNQLNKN
jgi:predicted nucleic acid-binding protein